MRSHAYSFLATFGFVLSACGNPQAPIADQTSVATDAPTTVQSRGQVVAITPEYNAITISHEAIPEFDMAAMTMEFTVADASQLAELAVGDQVNFGLSGPIDIATIHRAPPD
ncbi:MAG: copper-binding protein [Hyphomonadaceae bacterium]|nr:copper-binding protein [Hyphomonadaceae bacterium]